MLQYTAVYCHQRMWVRGSLTLLLKGKLTHWPAHCNLDVGFKVNVKNFNDSLCEDKHWAAPSVSRSH